jgi:hypothetical protein
VSISVVQVGSNSVQGVGTTLAVTVPAGGVPAGKRLIVSFSCNGGTADPDPTIADSKGNTWVRDEYNTGATRQLAVFSAPVTTALVSGDTITVTHVSTARRNIRAIYANVGAKDVSSNNGGTGTTSITSGATGTRAQPSSLGFGTFAYNSSVSTTTFTPGSGFNQVGSTLVAGTGSSWQYQGDETQVFLATGTDAATATLLTGQPYGGAMVVYPELLPSAALSGTAAAGITEADVVAGGKTIILTLTNTKWIT